MSRAEHKPFFANAWVHVTLAFGLAVFLTPFLWMVLTSLRTDEELIEPGFFPRVPTFVESSPYARPAPALSKPMDVPQEKWDAMLPKLSQMTGKAIETELKSHPVDGVEVSELVHATTPALINGLAPKISRAVWAGAEKGLVAAYEAQLTPVAVAKAIDERLARFELRSVTLRTIDGHVIPLCEGSEIAGKWHVESGSAKLVGHADAAVLHYDFSGSAATPIVLRYDFDLPTDPRNLHKLIVGVKADNSWHRIDAALDFGGGHWVSDRTTYIAQHRPSSYIFQPPSFDDSTFRNKVWVPLKRKDEGGRMKDEGKANSASFTLTITPSSTLQAIVGKVKRNYERAFYQVPFTTYIINSIVLVLLVTIGTLFSSTFIAYAFARLNWPGRSVALVLLLSTMMLPSQVTMIPQFVIWRQLGWYNTLNPLWAPAWLGGAFFIFLMTQHMKTIPRELEEAARIDGLNAVQTWWYIIVPLVKPAAAAIAIMTVMASWNEFMGPLIYLRDQAKFPLSLGLFGLRVDAGNDWTLLMAGNVMMTVPVLVMFFLFQRYFIQGMTMSGMKG